MRLPYKWALAAFTFLLLGAIASAMVFLLTGLPVFGAAFLDHRLLSDGLSSPPSTDWRAAVGVAGLVALGFAVGRFLEALLFGLAWVFFSNRGQALLVTGAIVLPLAFELSCGLLPLSSSWVGNLAVSIYHFRHPPDYVLPLAYASRVALSYLAPSMLASLLALVLLSRFERRGPRPGVPDGR